MSKAILNELAKKISERSAKPGPDAEPAKAAMAPVASHKCPHCGAPIDLSKSAASDPSGMVK